MLMLFFIYYGVLSPNIKPLLLALDGSKLVYFGSAKARKTLSINGATSARSQYIGAAV